MSNIPHFVYICKKHYQIMVTALNAQVKKELTENILPYWTTRMCPEDGSFNGRMCMEIIERTTR